MTLNDLKETYSWLIPQDNKDYFTHLYKNKDKGVTNNAIRGKKSYETDIKNLDKNNPKVYRGERWTDCTLPNCVGLAGGAFNATLNKVLKTSDDPIYFVNMSANAKEFMNSYGNHKFEYNGMSYICNVVKSSEYPKAIPTLFSIMCWSSGEYGHVAFVVGYKYEKGKTTGVYTLESNWYSNGRTDDTVSLYLIRERSISDNFGSDYQGFICNPFFNFNANAPQILDIKPDSLYINVSVQSPSVRDLGVVYDNTCLYYVYNKPLDISNLEKAEKIVIPSFNGSIVFNLEPKNAVKSVCCFVTQEYGYSKDDKNELFGNMFYYEFPNKTYIIVDGVTRKATPYLYINGVWKKANPFLYKNDGWNSL